MAKFKNKNNLDCCGDTTRGLFSANPAGSPHSEGPIFQSAFLWVQMQPSREEMTGPDQKEQRNAEQHSLRGNLPWGCLTSGPPQNHDASQLSTNTTHLTHRGAASWVTWNNTGLPLSHDALADILYQNGATCNNNDPFFPKPLLRTPTGIELGPMTSSWYREQFLVWEM